jgi:N-acetylneuraminic acid mutarotase
MLSAQGQGTWEQLTDMPGQARTFATGFAVNGHGYVGMGSYAPGPVYVPDLWKYDPVASNWSQAASFPLNIQRSVAVTIGDKVFFGTGQVFQTGVVTHWYEYDPAVDQWSVKASAPSPARMDALSFKLNGMAYIGGGIGTQSTTAFQDLHAYDPATNQWTPKAGPPSPLSNAACFTIGNKGYAVGGWHGVGSFSSATLEYDADSDSWSTKAPFPGGLKSGMLAFAIGGKGYVGMGYHDEWSVQWYAYDPALDQWQSVPAFTGPQRLNAAAFQIGSSGYIATGYGGPTNIYFNDLWKFTPDITTSTNTIHREQLQVFPNPSEGRVVVVGEPDAGAVRITLVDALGRVVRDQEHASRHMIELDLSAVPAGIYHLHYRSQGAERVARLVIQ